MKHKNLCDICKSKFIKGITLIELLIVLAIIGILSTISYPSYVEFIIRSNTAEATADLVRLANLQEQFFVDNRVYTDNIAQLGIGVGETFTTENDHFRITANVPNENGNTFTLTATALDWQFDNDIRIGCRVITITETGAKAPDICWE
jgi:type IV pilus assembly protein PilE